ncbi:hypothetical protein CEP52_006106, partial [Fusarium oligoseptatum]
PPAPRPPLLRLVLSPPALLLSPLAPLPPRPAPTPTGTATEPTGTATEPTGTETGKTTETGKGHTTTTCTTETESKPTKAQTTPYEPPYTTKTIYTTQTHTYTKCPAYTIAVSTTVCPVEEQYTTKTIYSTKVYTLTKCPAYVTDCPNGPNGPYTTTKTYPVSTTVCPITEEHPAKPTVYSPPEQYTTKTIYSTKTIPVSTTVCPVTEEHPAKPTVYSPPKGATTLYKTQTYTITKCVGDDEDCYPGKVTTTCYPTGTAEIPSYTTVIVPGGDKPGHEEPSKPTQPGYETPETLRLPRLPPSLSAPVPETEESSTPVCPGGENCPEETSKGQPSATLPYSQPTETGDAPITPVTAGAGRIGVSMAVAAIGVFAVLL